MTTAHGTGGRRYAPRWLWGVLGILTLLALASVWLVGDVERFLYSDAQVLPAGAQPVSLSLSPDGKTIYVANMTGGVTPVSATTGRAGRPIPIRGQILPTGGTPALAITPDNRTLFTEVIGRDGSQLLPLVRADLSTGRETGQVRVPGGVSDFVMSKDGKTLYVISGHGALFAVNAITDGLERQIPAPPDRLDSETAMALSPDGRALYIASSREGNDVNSTGAVTPINLRTGSVGTAVSVGWEPVALAVTQDSRTLYAAIDGMHGPDGPESPDRIVAIDTATNRISASVPWQVPPCNLVMAPDGKILWVASARGNGKSTADNTLTPVTVAGNQPGKSFRASGWLNGDARTPVGLAISPDGRTLYAAVTSGLEVFRTAGP